ncbi:hypothetical protein HYALB_00010574 [Hymenoscyphus albidus]|uniref:Uncharacterized protein n=1 Tax=Hymenoscyphus albidus TaxID=595503 RepID=A0A9N9LER9_9HELO|nr:hypothetical protein HYALB_00010574 [Hymenoscyphus albidus]
MHLNIPPRNESEAQVWTKNFKWGLVGVVAPELVVSATWRQYNSARAFQDILEKVSTDNQKYVSKNEEFRYESRADIEPRHRWTMVHSFYAGMGGFVVEPDGPANEGGPVLTVSARGMAFLARCGHLPNISKDDIKDKSKADGLAKSFVCIQAGWMVVQVLGRVINDLPVTLLEVNTLGHVLCALIIYLLWWYKPRMVREPTKLEGDWVAPLCAYMYMSSKISGKKSRHAGLLRQTWYEPEISDLTFFTQPAPSPLHDSGNLTPSPGPEREDKIDFSGGHFGIRPPVGDSTNGFVYSGTAELAQVPSGTQVKRWKLADIAVQEYPTIRERFESTLCEPSKQLRNDTTWLRPTTEELLTASASNWPEEELLRGTEGLVMGMILWCASMAYGAVHIAAWNDHFPTSAKKYLWQISAIYIAASGLLWLLINLAAHTFRYIDEYWDTVLALRAHWTNYLVLGFLCSICGIAYAVARIFLVVEAFISIRKLPVAAYETPDWTQNIPHL